jgi:DNA gyrase subunit A
VNVFPLAQGETITNFMPLPEDEKLWDSMHLMFATMSGNVRRNDLSDFHDIRSSGKIAMKLDEGDKLIGVMTCNETDQILLSAKSGKCIRFPVDAVRVFKSRTSDGVRGMKLAEKDTVISMSVLKGVDCTTEERVAYLKMAAAKRRAQGEEAEAVTPDAEDASVQAITLSEERFAQLAAQEQFILTVTQNGYGKRSSAYEYRVTNRAGSGIVSIITSARNGGVIASFPVEESSQIMLMTDKAKLIRTPVVGVRIAGRNTQGVTILKTAEAEKVVSATAVKEGDDAVEMDENLSEETISESVNSVEEN